MPTCAAFLGSTITTLVSRESLNSCNSSISIVLESISAADNPFATPQSEVWGEQETGLWGGQEAGLRGAQEVGVQWAWEVGVRGLLEAEVFILEDCFNGVEESLPRERDERSKDMLSSSEGGWSRLWPASLLDCT